MAEISDGRGYRRLNSWKEIASFFGKDERTVKRWESARGLPVRRVPGGNRTTVFAYAEELEAWLNGEGEKPSAAIATAPAAPAAAQKRPSVLAWLVPLLLAIGIAGGLVYVNTLRAGTSPSRHTPNPAAQELYLSATYDLNTRTGDGIRRSIDTFGQAIEHDPDYAEAYAGLATAYNLVSQYTMAAPAESYAAARQAAEHAIALDPELAAAHAALGFNLFNNGHDFAGSAAEFERALALDPNDAQAMHWYALTSMQLGRFEHPLELMAKAQQLQPTSRPIRANRALIMFHAGQVEGALSILEGMRQEFPDYLATPSYLATIYLDQRRYPEFLKPTRKRRGWSTTRRASASRRRRGRASRRAARRACSAPCTRRK